MDVIERFLHYVSFDTQSDELSETVPSSLKQRVLGQALAEELTAIGLSDAVLDDFGYVYAFLPATKGYESIPTLGLIAHMDTSPDVSGANVRPRIVRYEGGDLPLENGDALKVADFPFLERYRGQELIVTDGRTLLGADDKAGVAEILSACAYLVEHPEIPHGRIAVGITPDEEIGRGADHFDLARFAASVAYTVDGGELGEIEYENFNAASAHVRVRGVNIHPGSAKDRMKNAILMANEYLSMLPPAETPAHTEGYEGFYHVHTFTGCESEAEIGMIVRDHDRAKFEARKRFLTDLTAYLNGVYGEGSFTLTLKDSYYNMKEKILDHMELIENAERAMRAVGVEPRIIPIRGGTDGARLSYEGLPCPNLSTGGANFHGVHEFIPVESMRAMVRVLVELVRA
ncbi:MAG: peptidase T [Clostridia bacterium]|nr:peptidase T [Clostridia bacterium]